MQIERAVTWRVFPAFPFGGVNGCSSKKRSVCDRVGTAERKVEHDDIGPLRLHLCQERKRAGEGQCFEAAGRQHLANQHAGLHLVVDHERVLWQCRREPAHVLVLLHPAEQ
jgi:hypothetical protein